MGVTRLEIADIIEDTFGPRGAARADLLATATTKNAPPQVLEALSQLPDIQFPTMRHLWGHIPEVPVD